MEKYNRYIRLNIINIIILYKMINTSNTIPIKTPILYFTELEAVVLKCIWRNKEPAIVFKPILGIVRDS